MPKPLYRQMWMVPRNIRRIEPWKVSIIATLLDLNQGNVQSQTLQNQIYDKLSQQGVKCERSANGVANPGGYRTYLAQLACLGLFWRDADSTYKPTHAGEMILNHIDPTKVMICQLLRMQYPSVYGQGQNVRIAPSIRVKPFVFLLELLERPELQRRISSEDIAVAVVYGHTHSDLQRCVQKILQLRQGATFAQILDDPDDLNTPRRYQGSPDDLLAKGRKDALNIGNTFKNYLQAVGMLVPVGVINKKEYYALDIDPSLAADVAKWRKESLEPAPVPGHEASWQLRYGRYDQQKAVPVQTPHKTNGTAQFFRALYLAAASQNPYGFDHQQFVADTAKKWAKQVVEIESYVAPLKTKTSQLYRDQLRQAAFSGTLQSRELEIGVSNIFKKLGFELTQHCGQKKPANRQGGYPDVYIRTAAIAESGWADSKASANYLFPLNDKQKLSTYYHDCWVEIDPAAPSAFFLYVAGNFQQQASTVQRNLVDCTNLYGRAVSAITVEALCDLVEMPQPPDVHTLWSVLKRGGFFNSASQLVSGKP